MTTEPLLSFFKYLAELAPQGGNATLIGAMGIALLGFYWFVTRTSTLPPPEASPDQQQNGGTTMEKAVQTMIRVTKAELDAWEAAARADRRTLSEWIARRCNGERTTGPLLPMLRKARKSRRKRKAL